MSTHNKNNELAPASGRDEGGANAITVSQTMDMLALGECGPARPVDLVIAQLARDGGAASIAARAASELQVDVAALLDERTALRTLRQAKELAKRRMETNAGDVAAVATYFLAVASGLTHHDVNLSSRAGAELMDAIIDLGGACPAPWRDLLRAAALRLADLDSAPKD